MKRLLMLIVAMVLLSGVAWGETEQVFTHVFINEGAVRAWCRENEPPKKLKADDPTACTATVKELRHAWYEADPSGVTMFQLTIPDPNNKLCEFEISGVTAFSSVNDGYIPFMQIEYWMLTGKKICKSARWGKAPDPTAWKLTDSKYGAEEDCFSKCRNSCGNHGPLTGKIKECYDNCLSKCVEYRDPKDIPLMLPGSNKYLDPTIRMWVTKEQICGAKQTESKYGASESATSDFYKEEELIYERCVKNCGRALPQPLSRYRLERNEVTGLYRVTRCNNYGTGCTWIEESGVTNNYDYVSKYLEKRRQDEAKDRRERETDKAWRPIK